MLPCNMAYNVSESPEKFIKHRCYISLPPLQDFDTWENRTATFWKSSQAELGYS